MQNFGSDTPGAFSQCRERKRVVVCFFLPRDYVWASITIPGKVKWVMPFGSIGH